MLGWFDDRKFFDPLYADSIVVLPDGVVEQQEVNQYKTDQFFYYYNIWENFHFFGLPNGKGWGNEPLWLIEFLKTFEKAFRKYETFTLKKVK